MSRPALEACLADFDPADHAGEELHVGIDLSATQDITAMGFVVPTGVDAEGRTTFDAWVEGWTPAATLSERALRDQTPYDLWVQQGWLHATPGRIVRYDFVAARLAEITAGMDTRAVAFDQYAFRKSFEPEMDAQGLTLPVIEHPQGGKKKGATGLWMPGSKASLETLILEKRIRLRRSPLLIAAMMSAATEEDPFGNAWFSKRKATARIDALVALAMAVGSATSSETTQFLDVAAMVV
jgi:phage terminase large subunit-like protein